MDKEITKKYSNGEITVVWKPHVCIHSAVCWKLPTGLPEVFNPQARPWINMEGADTERITAHVQNCPSGALSFFRNETQEDKVEVTTDTQVEVSPNGPLLVY